MSFLSIMIVPQPTWYMFLKLAGLSARHMASTNPTKWHRTQKGKDFLYAQGRRIYDRKLNYYGRQTKPVFQKKATTIKNIVLRLECVEPNCRSKRDVSILNWEEIRK